MAFLASGSELTNGVESLLCVHKTVRSDWSCRNREQLPKHQARERIEKAWLREAIIRRENCTGGPGVGRDRRAGRACAVRRRSTTLTYGGVRWCIQKESRRSDH